MTPPLRTAGESTPISLIQWDSSWPKCLSRPERDPLLAFLQERFGIPRTLFNRYDLYKRGTTVWLLNKDPRLRDLAALKVESVGFLLLRWVQSRLKPTSAALQLFGNHLNKNIVRLTPEQLRDLVERTELEGDFAASPGYVATVTDSLVIGCALYVPGRLISQFPRHMFTSQMWQHMKGR